MRWSVNTTAVWLIQSANEILKYGLTKHSRKENLTKDNIPTIFEPVIDTQDFEEYKVQRNNKHCSIGKENKVIGLLGTYDQPMQVKQHTL